MREVHITIHCKRRSSRSSLSGTVSGFQALLLCLIDGTKVVSDGSQEAGWGFRASSRSLICDISMYSNSGGSGCGVAGRKAAGTGGVLKLYVRLPGNVPRAVRHTSPRQACRCSSMQMFSLPGIMVSRLLVGCARGRRAGAVQRALCWWALLRRVVEARPASTGTAHQTDCIVQAGPIARTGFLGSSFEGLLCILHNATRCGRRSRV